MIENKDENKRLSEENKKLTEENSGLKKEIGELKEKIKKHKWETISITLAFISMALLVIDASCVDKGF